MILLDGEQVAQLAIEAGADLKLLLSASAWLAARRTGWQIDVTVPSGQGRSDRDGGEPIPFTVGPGRAEQTCLRVPRSFGW